VVQAAGEVGGVQREEVRDSVGLRPGRQPGVVHLHALNGAPLATMAAWTTIERFHSPSVQDEARKTAVLLSRAKNPCFQPFARARPERPLGSPRRLSATSRRPARYESQGGGPRRVVATLTIQDRGGQVATVYQSEGCDTIATVAPVKKRPFAATEKTKKPEPNQFRGRIRVRTRQPRVHSRGARQSLGQIVVAADISQAALPAFEEVRQPRVLESQ